MTRLLPLNPQKTNLTSHNVTRLLTYLLCTFTAIAPTLTANAQATASQPEQYRFDLGAGLGMSGYLGDANESSMWAHPGVAFNASFRYLINTRFALRALVNVAGLSGSTADMENVLPGGQTYDFKSTLYDLQARGEYNFFSYGIGETYKQLRRFTPYLALGVGVSMASTDSQTFAAMTIPMALGIKYKVKPRLNVGLEFAMTKVLGDHADSPVLSDMYLIKSSFIKNTDWYSTLTLSISYEFGERCIECHRLD